MQYRLAASLSCANPICLKEDFEQLERSDIDVYHIDLCDGVFAPTFLLSTAAIRALRALSKRRFDVHLYCHQPSLYLEDLRQSGADVVIVHVETRDENYKETILKIRAAGMSAGLAILPTSCVPNGLEDTLPLVSVVVANCVGPAFAGQAFNPNGLRNMRTLSNLVKKLGLEVEIAADGSVRSDRLPMFLEAGCNHFVCGTSSIFQPGDMAANVHKFRVELIEQVRRINPLAFTGEEEKQ
jgi:ribulose-phosphate 3-epimerase